MISGAAALENLAPVDFNRLDGLGERLAVGIGQCFARHAVAG
jgi:hypothetical protein